MNIPTDNNFPIIIPRETKPNRKRGIVVAALGMLVVVGVGGIVLSVANTNKTNTELSQAKETQVATPAVVAISEEGVIPRTLTISQNQSVTWRNDGTNLLKIVSTQVNSEAKPSFESPAALTTRDSFTHTFSQKGTFSYYDAFSGKITGSVTVE